MVAKTQVRRSLLECLESTPSKPTTPEDSYAERCTAIEEGRLIPIFGDAIRIAHIFEGAYSPQSNSRNESGGDDQEIGYGDTGEEEGNSEEGVGKTEGNIGQLSTTERLAQFWAQKISYPLKDDYQIARVAQFNRMIIKDSTKANRNYLTFIKNKLLEVAEYLSNLENDTEQLAFVRQLRQEQKLSFSDIAAELDFPYFIEDSDDPLRILAWLPLRIYITTGYHDFIERELVAVGKHPQSRLCFWNLRPDNVAIDHRDDPDYIPSVTHPVVYHLFGMEQYPESLVLCEDDYLDLLWALARNHPGDSDSGDQIIPSFLEAELENSSLLLLGYRLKDWDLSLLFRGLLRGVLADSQRACEGAAIHLDLSEQPFIRDEKKAKIYIENYFGQARIEVLFGKSDDFIAELWQKWSDS